jgi:hypothetical protein
VEHSNAAGENGLYSLTELKSKKEAELEETYSAEPRGLEFERI